MWNGPSHAPDKKKIFKNDDNFEEITSSLSSWRSRRRQTFDEEDNSDPTSVTITTTIATTSVTNDNHTDTNDITNQERDNEYRNSPPSAEVVCDKK